MAQSLAQRGILTLRFDFRYVGESSGRFADITYSGEVEDLAAADHRLSDPVDMRRAIAAALVWLTEHVRSSPP